MENKDNINVLTDTKEIINENSKFMPVNHPTAIRSEQVITKTKDNTIIVNNYYLTMNNQQYMHFAKCLYQAIQNSTKYYTEKKTNREILLSKGLEMAIDKYGDVNKSLMVSDVAKDLKMGENLANKLFRRPDFPAICIGKTKTVSAIAYEIWKMEHKDVLESEVISNG